MRALSPVRAAVGAVRLALPDMVIPWWADRPLDARGRRAVRLLGARQLTQALVTGPNPVAATLWLGTEADLAHAASMIGVALVASRYRRDAFGDAAIALAFAWAGIRAARSAPARRDRAFPLAAWRDRSADRLARRLVPGYSRAASWRLDADPFPARKSAVRQRLVPGLSD
ncbi:MAG TPA: hypothetical protein VI138_00995 [Candidatus Dormibacteraeota bacterium]